MVRRIQDSWILLFGDREVIVGERNQVGELAGSNCAFLAAFTAKPTAALREESQRFLRGLRQFLSGYIETPPTVLPVVSQ